MMRINETPGARRLEGEGSGGGCFSASAPHAGLCVRRCCGNLIRQMLDELLHQRWALLLHTAARQR
jgi:hypothetical protein